MNLGSRDFISDLPDCLICHILSFVSTKESASTSLLSKRWRYLFALLPNLDFDDSIYFNPNKKITRKANIPRSFVDFVDRVLVLQKDVPLNRFSLKCKGVVHSAIVIGWILKVLALGVVDLDLQIPPELYANQFPPEVFVNKTLVRLKIRTSYEIGEQDVFLPKVKFLCLENASMKNDSFARLISGCQALEELVLNDFSFESRGLICNVTSTTLKRVMFRRSATFNRHYRILSFDTPNLVYLEFFDSLAHIFPIVKFNSLVEATLGFRMTPTQIIRLKRFNDEQIGKVTNLLMGISNVKTLYLSDGTLEVITYCCNPSLKFNNLIHLTIKTDEDVAWESLPVLLKNCPKLETLIFEGLHPNFTKYGPEEDGCLRKLWDEIPTCLSSSPLKVGKILKFGELYMVKMTKTNK